MSSSNAKTLSFNLIEARDKGVVKEVPRVLEGICEFERRDSLLLSSIIKSGYVRVLDSFLFTLFFKHQNEEIKIRSFRLIRSPYPQNYLLFHEKNQQNSDDEWNTKPASYKAILRYNKSKREMKLFRNEEDIQEFAENVFSLLTSNRRIVTLKGSEDVVDASLHVSALILTSERYRSEKSVLLSLIEFCNLKKAPSGKYIILEQMFFETPGKKPTLIFTAKGGANSIRNLTEDQFLKDYEEKRKGIDKKREINTGVICSLGTVNRTGCGLLERIQKWILPEKLSDSSSGFSKADLDHLKQYQQKVIGEGGSLSLEPLFPSSVTLFRGKQVCIDGNCFGDDEEFAEVLDLLRRNTNLSELDLVDMKNGADFLKIFDITETKPSLKSLVFENPQQGALQEAVGCLVKRKKTPSFIELGVKGIPIPLDESILMSHITLDSPILNVHALGEVNLGDMLHDGATSRTDVACLVLERKNRMLELKKISMTPSNELSGKSNTIGGGNATSELSWVLSAAMPPFTPSGNPRREALERMGSGKKAITFQTNNVTKVIIVPNGQFISFLQEFLQPLVADKESNKKANQNKNLKK